MYIVKYMCIVQFLAAYNGLYGQYYVKNLLFYKNFIILLIYLCHQKSSEIMKLHCQWID